MSTNKPFLFKTRHNGTHRARTTEKRSKLRSFTALTSLFLLSTLLPLTASAITSTIQVTSSPFLSFVDTVDSFRITTNAPVFSADMEYTGDLSAQDLPPERYITIQDTRGSGGFNLQIQASEFQPAQTSPNPSLNNNFRIITSTNDAFAGTEENGIKYAGDGIDPYTGQTGIIAPLNTISTNFADPTLFTSSPFDGGINILTTDTPIDIMQGTLSAANGRNGLIHLSVSFYLLIPKFQAPGEYYSTLTYTLTDATT